MAANQAPKLARLIVRESPGLPSLAIFDHDTSLVAGDDLKWADREVCSHRAPLNVCKGGLSPGAVTSLPHHAFHSTAYSPPPLLTCSGETLTMIRVGAARQP